MIIVIWRGRCILDAQSPDGKLRAKVSLIFPELRRNGTALHHVDFLRQREKKRLRHYPSTPYTGTKIRKLNTNSERSSVKYFHNFYDFVKI